MAHSIFRTISPFEAVVDGVSAAVDAVENFYTPYSPYRRHYTVSDPNMRDAIRLAALGLTPADLAPQPSPFTNSVRKIKNSQKKNPQKKNPQNMDSINLAKNTYTPGDPTSFIKNSYAKYLKSTNKPDMLKLSDNSTGSGGIGVFDTPDNYTPITPNNSMLPHTAINMRNHFKQFMPITDTAKSEEYVKKMYAKQNELNRQLGAFNSPQDTQEQGDQDVPQNLLPVNLDYGTDTNTGTKNPIGKSVKKEVNQIAKKDTGSAKVDVKPETIQPVLTSEQIAYEKAKNATNSLESSAIIGDYYATQGAKKSVPNPKIALTEPQRDYYRYLTGYRRMDPNQAILSMGLDPNKYYY